MAVSLVKFYQIEVTNVAFIELAISFLIGMTNGGIKNLPTLRFSTDWQHLYSRQYKNIKLKLATITYHKCNLSKI
jgi:hypothetical protein